MTDETSRTQTDTAVDPADLARRLAETEDRLAFYASFDKLIQENIARSSELMREAAALREQANADVREAQAERERVKAESERLIAEAARRAADERRRYGEALLAIQGDLASVQDATAAIARRVGTILGDLGVAGFVPVAWAAAAAGAAAAADEPTPAPAVAADGFAEAAEELPPAAEAEVAAQAEVAVAPEVAIEAEPSAAEPAADDAPPGVWDPLSRLENGVVSTGRLVALSGTGTGELSLETEPGKSVPDAPDAWEAAIPAYPHATAPDAAERDAASPGNDRSSEAGATAGPVDELNGSAGADPFAARYDPAAQSTGQPMRHEEGFLGGHRTPPDSAAEAPGAVAVEAEEPEPRAIMALIHGVPRAAAALSLQRHLAGLPHVEGVEAREYAEGILRLQVTARRPLELADLRSWDNGADLEPVHVQDDVIEVRLPGAHGF